MKADVSADQARRRSDDVVRRLREESARRRGLRTAGMSSCMLGTMVALLLFVALQARRIHWIAEANNASARAQGACANFERRVAEIEATKRERLAVAFDAQERRQVEIRAFAQITAAQRFASQSKDGCETAPHAF